jgi:hypothetical protein
MRTRRVDTCTLHGELAAMTAVGGMGGSAVAVFSVNPPEGLYRALAWPTEAVGLNMRACACARQAGRPLRV